MHASRLLDALAQLIAREDSTHVRRAVRRLFVQEGVRRAAVLELLARARHTPWQDNEGLRRALVEYEATYLRSGRGKDVDVLKQAIAGLPYPSRDAAQLLSRVVLHDNRTTGRMYEKSLAAIVMKRVLELSQDVPTLDLVHDREVRHVDLHGAAATRRLDLYFPQLNFAVEVKSGRVHLSRDIRRQIDIDSQLVRDGQLTGCLWFLVYGASPAVLDYLDASQIEVWDVGWTYR